MERNQILEEYWGLRKYLNLGNKVADERTVLQFKIEEVSLSEYRMMATVISENEIQKIELARRNRRGRWERSGFTNFTNFENYCAIFLNQQEEINRRMNIDDVMLNRGIILELSKEFQMNIENQLIGYEF